MATIVIALGGNALGDTPSQQIENVKLSAKMIVELAKDNHKIVICHGNGPQVGMINNVFNDAYLKETIKEPMPFCWSGAMSQGYIGYHIQNAIVNQLKKEKLTRSVVTLVTQTEVDAKDQAFLNPTKPIGSFMSENQAKTLAKANNWIVKEDAGRGWRRVVPSPYPQNIIEKDSVKNLLQNNVIVIAGGGGGVPVINKNLQLIGVAAVIDKDLTASKLAELVDANMFVILTAVDQVKINYQKPQEKSLKEVNLEQLKVYLKQNQFAPGSMLPKIEAAIEFVKRTKMPAFIGQLKDAPLIIKNQAGTKITV